jgi:hypothetical protein
MEFVCITKLTEASIPVGHEREQTTDFSTLKGCNRQIIRQGVGLIIRNQYRTWTTTLNHTHRTKKILADMNMDKY